MCAAASEVSAPGYAESKLSRVQCSYRAGIAARRSADETRCSSWHWQGLVALAPPARVVLIKPTPSQRAHSTARTDRIVYESCTIPRRVAMPIVPGPRVLEFVVLESRAVPG